MDRRLGEFLKKMPKAKGSDYHRLPRKDGNTTLPTMPPARLADIGLDSVKASRAQRLADIPEPEFRERIAVIEANGGKLPTTKHGNQTLIQRIRCIRI